MFVDLSLQRRESVAFYRSDICIKVLCIFYCCSLNYSSLCCHFDSSRSRQENINHRITGFNSHWSQAGVHAATSLQSWRLKQSESVGIISSCVAVLCSMTSSNQGQAAIILHIYHFQFLVSACKQNSFTFIVLISSLWFLWQAKKTLLMLFQEGHLQPC